MIRGTNAFFGTWHQDVPSRDSSAAQKEGGITGFAHSVLGAFKWGAQKKKAIQVESSYRIVSWNVATLRDYANVHSIHKKMKENLGFLEAYQSALNEPPYQATRKDIDKRRAYFQKAFLEFEHPDILCLQESHEMSSDDMLSMLPPGYSFFGYENRDGRECTLVWNSEKFTKIAHAEIFYDAEYISSINAFPDTIAVLRDLEGTTVCVASVHLRGFSLAYSSMTEVEKQRQLNYALAGDHQTEYDLQTMERVPHADLYLFAGDFNVTVEHYNPRFEILRRFGYITDPGDRSPTIYDANLKEEDGVTPQKIKLDYIFAKGRESVSIDVECTNLQENGLESFKRPSDHLPVVARVRFSYQKQE